MVSQIPNDIFQFSTVGALMGGLATSGPTASQLHAYGTHGIGTFENMDGELVYIDGKAWQFTSDGKACLADPNISLPFIQVTKFVPGYSSTVSHLNTESLLDVLSSQGPEAGGKNSFVTFSVKGVFKTLHARIGGPQLYHKQPLGEVAKKAKKWTAEGITATMWGVVSPEWSQGISVAGVHVHFLSEPDENGEVQGGHVVDFEIDDQVEVSWAVAGTFHLGMAKGKEWEDLELVPDPVGIREAEGSGHVTGTHAC